MAHLELRFNIFLMSLAGGAQEQSSLPVAAGRGDCKVASNIPD